MKLTSALLITFHLLCPIPVVFNYVCDKAFHANCSDDPSVFKCRINQGFVGRADDKIDICEACVCPNDPYCVTVLCDTKMAEKDSQVFYAFFCFNETDRSGPDYCTERMMEAYPKTVKKHFNCFCHLGPKGESMYNRNLIPKEKAPDDLQHLFSSPTKANSSSTKTGPLINLLLISNSKIWDQLTFDLFG
ncbi:hypothetical protein niasHS_000076 [Heterodera schachtii]|uniref:Uncharacterized protein n=1 Tax=Heterodera schachtii TaxID=97005 RepID=A0ABD2KMG2_HETSC